MYIYDVANWLKSNCNTHIAQFTQRKGNRRMLFGQSKEYNKRLVPDVFVFKKGNFI